MPRFPDPNLSRPPAAPPDEAASRPRSSGSVWLVPALALTLAACAGPAPSAANRPGKPDETPVTGASPSPMTPPSTPPTAAPPSPNADEPDFARALVLTPPSPLARAADGAYEGELRIQLAPGFHIYSPKETQSIPTSLSFQGQGDVKWPEAIEKDQGALGRHWLYTGEVRLPFRVVPAAGATQVKALLKYQVCTDKVCSFPETRPIDFPLST